MRDDNYRTIVSEKEASSLREFFLKEDEKKTQMTDSPKPQKPIQVPAPEPQKPIQTKPVPEKIMDSVELSHLIKDPNKVSLKGLTQRPFAGLDRLLTFERN